MKRARLAVGLLLSLLAPLSSGCELIADFDRGKIPKPAPDGGHGGTPDGGGGPAPDAGPASDAGPAPDAGPAADAGPPVIDAGGVGDAAMPAADAG